MKGKEAADKNPWDTDYNAEKAKAAGAGETLVDKAKSFSF